MTLARIAIAFALLIATAATAHADTRRFAIVVGNNAGHGADQTLRYAERDASRVAGLLRELGRFDALETLLGRDAQATLSALASMRRVAAERLAAGDQVLFVFFYSGHGGRDGLLLGASLLEHAALLAELRTIPSSVRIAIVDACDAGALIRDKGLHARAPVNVQLVDALGTSGEAILASTSRTEAAQESEELRGSFFTSHLLSGLRGAADRNRDGVVSLREAYEYAYDRTVAGTVISAAGMQRPTYAVRLKGNSDVPLAWPSRSRAFLQLRARSAGSFLILSQDESIVLAEIATTRGAEPRIALAPGSYWVKKRSERGVLLTRVRLDEGTDGVLDEDQMSHVPYATLAEKGSEPPGLLTVATGIASRLGEIDSSTPLSLQLGYVANFRRLAVWGSLALGGSHASDLDSTLLEIRPGVALLLRSQFRRWELYYGIGAGLPLYVQFRDQQRRAALGYGLDAIGGVAVWATDRIAITAHTELGGRVVQLDGFFDQGYQLFRRVGLDVGARLRF